MQCILGPFGPKINCRIFGLSMSFPPKVKFLDETLIWEEFFWSGLTLLSQYSELDCEENKFEVRLFDKQ